MYAFDPLSFDPARFRRGVQQASVPQLQRMNTMATMFAIPESQRQEMIDSEQTRLLGTKGVGKSAAKNWMEGLSMAKDVLKDNLQALKEDGDEDVDDNASDKSGSVRRKERNVGSSQEVYDGL